ncbi:STAS domain-containing protein [Baekduia soli]|uniref:Anti-sigma factor antagonist n=1 Tax=Baekduia soli TaxID=496014 RepID=A0A5B8U032_9ACTN|nr:STAS domain-containing protein [Baekduia soli]QEC46331.1 STAS domain-containing protein [Baekduia soli]
MTRDLAGFRIKSRRLAGGGSVVVSVLGDVDIATVPQLDAVLTEAAADAGHVIVDLRAVTFMDSSGLRLLVRKHQSARDSGHIFALGKPVSETVQRLLELTAMDRMFVFDDLP